MLWAFFYEETMKVSLFNYDLPEELIAQTPASPRDHSRLLVVDPGKRTLEDRRFYQILDYLKEGDVLVVNHSKVLPARLYGSRESGGVVEVLLLKRLERDVWECLAKPGRKVRVGERLSFSPNLRATCLEIAEDGGRILQFYYDGVFEEILDELGEMPLPPYIRKKLDPSERDRYQTVYHKDGESAAAPTAGLHFTRELLEAIRLKGVTIASVLLNVGLGTFRPVKSEDTDAHAMHEEYYEIGEDAAAVISKAKAEGRRVIAVGTTSVRVLESAWRKFGAIVPCKEWTDIFITPGYQFGVVDGLITNFHLPESTLIMLISAFMTREFTLEVYRTAVEREYRFFSFGDAMFIRKEE